MSKRNKQIKIPILNRNKRKNFNIDSKLSKMEKILAKDIQKEADIMLERVENSIFHILTKNNKNKIQAMNDIVDFILLGETITVEL